MSLSITAEQQARALELANDRRLQRVALKRNVKKMGRAGARELSRVLLHDHQLVGRVDIGVYLMWQPGIGRERAKDILKRQEMEISPWRAIYELTERQRAALALELEHYADYGYTRRWKADD